MKKNLLPFLKCSRKGLTLIRFATIPSSSGDDLDTVNKDDKLKKNESKIIANILPRTRDLFYSGRSQVPTSLGFPNPRGIEDYDPDIPMKQIIEGVPKVLYQETKKFMNEPYRYPMTLEKPDMFKSIRGSIHNEAVIYYTFKSEDSLKVWKIGCDSDWSEGYSKCDLYISNQKTAIFEGTLSTRIVKDGKTKRAGYCGMKTFDRMSFNRKKYFDIRHYTHIIIKCRGDGRSYKVMLHSPEYADATWGDSHSYPLHTHGGPYWQYERIPLSRFFHTVNGRIQDRQYSVRKCRLSSIGIVIMDRVDGDFRLELDFIGLTNDISHREKFAYEKYQLPVLTTVGV